MCEELGLIKRIITPNSCFCFSARSALSDGPCWSCVGHQIIVQEVGEEGYLHVVCLSVVATFLALHYLKCFQTYLYRKYA